MRTPSSSGLTTHCGRPRHFRGPARPDPAQVTALIDEHPRLGVAPVLRELHIPSSTYCRWRRAGKEPTAQAPNRLWVTDLTMISTGEGPLQLSAIRDAFSRRVVAWETSARADADLVLTLLECQRSCSSVLIHFLWAAAEGDRVQFGTARQELLELECAALVQVVRVRGDQPGGGADR
ncbi:DDE-type integrase/transposase/recombinase [Streptomyces sp. NBRC 110611]|uniref:DDE-type integrase/transposase/recombinase n=1 Tax=Streptomyces sp. NBRC 110611 TaxID=1621259 RepID=UPI0037DA761E